MQANPESIAAPIIPTQEEKNLAVFMANEKQVFLKAQSKNALNGTINYALALILALVLSATVLLSFIGVPLLLIVFILSWYSAIQGAVRSSAGELFEYPATFLRLVK